MARGLWRKLSRLIGKPDPFGDVEPGAFVCSPWGIEGWLVSVHGASGLVVISPGIKAIVELRCLRRASPDPAVAWLDIREGGG